MENADFQKFIEAIRQGREAEAEQLLRTYEPAIRRSIRRRLKDSELRRVFDSMDICQSIMAKFFVEMRAGRFELPTPEHLLRLLLTMARNKLCTKVRQQDHKGKLIPEGCDAIAPGPSPSEIVASQDLMEAIRSRLTEKERPLFDLRRSGLSWPEIAEKIGGKAHALQVRLRRAVGRVQQELEAKEARHAR